MSFNYYSILICLKLKQYIFSSEPAEVPNNEQNKMSDPTPKEASEIVKKVDVPANPDEKSVLPVTNPVTKAQEDTKKLSYASIVSTFFEISIKYTS